MSLSWTREYPGTGVILSALVDTIAFHIHFAKHELLPFYKGPHMKHAKGSTINDLGAGPEEIEKKNFLIPLLREKIFLIALLWERKFFDCPSPGKKKNF